MLAGSSNYESWKIRLEAELDIHDYRRLLESDHEPDPSKGRTNEEKEKLKKESESYRKTRGLVLRSLGEEAITAVTNEVNSKSLKAIMTFLEKKYVIKDDMAVGIAIRELMFFAVTATPGKMENYFDELEKLYSKVKRLGLPEIPEKWKVWIIVATLPEQLNPVFSRMKFDKDDYDYYRLRSMIIAEDQRQHQKEFGETSNEGVAMTARNKSYKNDKKKMFNCYECGKRGHYARDCRNKKSNSKKSDDYSMIALQSVQRKAFHVENRKNSEMTFFVDSAASKHMCNNRSALIDSIDLCKPIPIQVANNDTINAVATGTLKFVTGKKRISIENVEYVEGLSSNLLSVRQMTKKGFVVTFKGDECIITAPDGKVVMTSTAGVEDLYTINIKLQSNDQKAKLTKQVNDSVWYKRLCHINAAKVQTMKKNHTYIKCYKDLCEQCVMTTIGPMETLGN